MAAFDERIGELQERVDLRGFELQLRIHELGGAGGLTKLHEFGKGFNRIDFAALEALRRRFAQAFV